MALITCLNLLGNLGDAIKREVERKAQTVLGQKIDHLTSICKDIQKTTTTEERQTMKPKPLYAEVAARVPLPRPILRTRIDDSNTTPPAQLLTDVKKTYNHAIAVHRLPSGDVDIRFDTQAHRDAAAGAPSPPGFTVFNKQYLVEIPGVPLIVQVRNHRQADNSDICREIERASVKSCGSFKAKSIRWLRDPEKTSSQSRKPTRGSLILGVSTEAEQRGIVRGGIVIGGEYYAARFFESALVHKQCFRCGRWGHKQGACTRKPTCLQCAGPHDTRTCTADHTTCGNCGKKHRAWQREPCPVFQRYRETIAQRRMMLWRASEACRAPNWHPTLREPVAVQVETQGRKRARAATEANDPPRWSGRPKDITVAARDASQHRLVFGRTEMGLDNSEDNMEE